MSRQSNLSDQHPTSRHYTSYSKHGQCPTPPKNNKVRLTTGQQTRQDQKYPLWHPEPTHRLRPNPHPKHAHYDESHSYHSCCRQSERCHHTPQQSTRNQRICYNLQDRTPHYPNPNHTTYQEEAEHFYSKSHRLYRQSRQQDKP